MNGAFEIGSLVLDVLHSRNEISQARERLANTKISKANLSLRPPFSYRLACCTSVAPKHDVTEPLSFHECVCVCAR